jgi:hypothetical protein
MCQQPKVTHDDYGVQVVNNLRSVVNMSGQTLIGSLCSYKSLITCVLRTEYWALSVALPFPDSLLLVIMP